MPHDLITIIQSEQAEVRDRSLELFCREANREQLLQACAQLDQFRRRCANLYQRVRALFFLSTIHRYYLPDKLPENAHCLIPRSGYYHLLNRRFEEAITEFLAVMETESPSHTICSALATAYRELGFQTLADQVRRSVRSIRGNQWMFRTGHPSDHPLRLRSELLRRQKTTSPFPILCEQTPVRMDLSHSAWSDIFFLGMDFPEGARVLNVSVDLGVRGRDQATRPPVEVFLRVIDEPILRLSSLDLKTTADVDTLAEVFDFAKDYLGLLKAGIIASGVISPGLEGAQQGLDEVLARVVGPGLGLELITKVNDIPKGSRLAVSTNLLAGIIAACMRATGQIRSLTGGLTEVDRRIVAARAILGEWLGGSGGGWQDSGGVWPGIKMIEGARAGEEDPEWEISRGRLLPNHRVYSPSEISHSAQQKLCDSLVLVHGGMGQNVGPILEMVTEKYLLRSGAEWEGRQQAIDLMQRIESALCEGDIQSLAKATTENFFGPIRTIIPWACNHYTQTLIQRVQAQFADKYWGFLMLGGMSGGGMGFFFAPEAKQEAADYLQTLMNQTKTELETALPFAMEPLVYDFSINPDGTKATLLEGAEAFLPSRYYAMVAPQWLRTDRHAMAPARQREYQRFSAACRTDARLGDALELVFDSVFPGTAAHEEYDGQLGSLLADNGFDAELHERIRSDLRDGRIGLAQNRLSANTQIEDVQLEDLVDTRTSADPQWKQLGERALADGRVGVVSLAAGAGSRWTEGAGVVKALHPFHRFQGAYRSFIEVHLAKSRRTAQQYGTSVPHVITTSYLTHDPIARSLERHGNYGYEGALYPSRGRSVGLRMIPMSRDLRFAWEEMPQQIHDEQSQKVIESLRAALIGWAKNAGGASDYTDNLPLQCLHPVGHWFEIPNLMLNGTLLAMLEERPQLKYLMLHNIDTLGADLNAGMLGLHIAQQAGLTYEIIGRRIEDAGGGLARVNGQVRLIESMALPREDDEFKLHFYNTMTTWIDIDRLLDAFGLDRDSLQDIQQVAREVRQMSLRLPTYVTLKDVKKRWGHGQEDVYPVAQFEKLWGDMTTLPEIRSQFAVVSRMRGQQLKEQAQLDSWVRDGSAEYVDTLCRWD